MPEEIRLDDAPAGGPEQGIALCLSGGGYRAMVFHVGAIIRLNEAGLLGKLSRVSSVSGGSITAGLLGLLWRELQFGGDGRAARLSVFTDRILEMASTSVDAGAIIGGVFLPGTISERVADAYDEVLFKGAKLAQLPDDAKGEGPRFVINATNVQSGVLWRFSRGYMGDYRVGLVKDPDVRLADAVAASSAFPPVLSPATLKVKQPFSEEGEKDFARPEYRKRVVLSDGGVYDNLGLETAYKRYRTLLVSDGGQQMKGEEDPADDWARHSIRILGIIDNQVRSLRKRHLVDAFQSGQRSGTYWGLRTNFADYRLAEDPLGCAGRDSSEVAATPTRLQKMPRELQERLVNWGYAICDAALRAHWTPALQKEYATTIAAPRGFPFARGY